MNKILVTTDFSAHSKAGLRFAIQLATQFKFELTFFHSYFIMRPSSWNDKTFNEYEKVEANKIQKKLNRFTESVYKSMAVVPQKIDCKIKKSVYTENNIIEYAREHKFDYICISTRGAGKLKKIFGTNTSNLINHSNIPVIAVPHNYRKSKVKSILYASDLTSLESELKKVAGFAEPLNAKVELLHFNSIPKSIADSEMIVKVVKKFPKCNIKPHLKNVSLENTLISNIETAIKKSKPSLLIMFTQQNKNFYESILLPSKSAEYSFHPKIPLLVFNKI